MSGWTKLFNTIITSSVWSEDDKTRIMWVTMLASSDATGHVSGSIPGMAAIARMSLEDAERTIKSLCSADPYSRSKECEGRRLLEVDGGWQIVNYVKYRQQRDLDKRQGQNREAKRRQRQRGNQMSAKCQPMSANVSMCQHVSAAVSSRQHVSSPVSNGQHVSAAVSNGQHGVMLTESSKSRQDNDLQHKNVSQCQPNVSQCQPMSANVSQCQPMSA